MLRATPWSTGDGLRLGLEAGARAVGRDGRVLRAQHARAAGARRARRDFVRARAAVRDARDGAQRATASVYAPRTWSEIDVVQWTARQPGARAWYEVADEDARARACATARSREMIEAARARRRAGRAARRRRRWSRSWPAITTTLGGLRIDTDARAAPGVFACGADAGGIATGGYASGLAAALVFGRIAARLRARRSRLRRPMQHAFGTSDPLTLGIEEELLLVDPRDAPARARRRAGAGGDRAARALAAHEAYASEVELRTPICRNASRGARELQLAGGAAAAAARAAGATLMAAGCTRRRSRATCSWSTRSATAGSTRRCAA